MKKMVNQVAGASDPMPAEPFPSLLERALEAERQLLETLPTLISEAQDQTLRRALEHHLEETCDHVANLEAMFGCIGLRHTHEELRDKTPEDRGDLVVAAAAAATEHAEISIYEALRAMAEAMGTRLRSS